MKLGSQQQKIVDLMKEKNAFIEDYNDVDGELSEIYVTDLDGNDYMWLTYEMLKSLLKKQIIEHTATYVPALRIEIKRYRLKETV
jgi:hypothetical protein